MGSLSIRRFAAAARSRARSKSATVYCRGSGRVRFLRGRFAALLPRMSRFPVATCRSDYSANRHFDACFAFVHESSRSPLCRDRTDSAEVAGAFFQYHHRVTALIDFQLDHDHGESTVWARIPIHCVKSLVAAEELQHGYPRELYRRRLDRSIDGGAERQSLQYPRHRR